MRRLSLQAILLFFALNVFGQSHQLAILDICDRNAEINKENLASAIQMADVAGTPYIVTTDLEEALAYPFVLITSSLREGTFQSSEVQELESYVNNGGVLVASYIRNSAYFELFGISQTNYNTNRYQVIWDQDGNHPELKWINDSLEKELPLARADKDYSIDTRGYTPTTCQVLATFEDHSAAVIKNNYGNGKAYAFGFQLQDVILRNLLDRDYSAQRTWSNGFEPATDVYLLFLRAVFTANQPIAVYKHTSPGISSSVLMITHDVDSRTGMDSMYYFSEWEASQGIKAHYFVTTHYLRDVHMSAFYNEETIPKIQSVLAHGHIIGSHSVGHFPDFDNRSRFPEGTTGNTEENYRPVYVDGVTIGGTVTGETEVSRYLLNTDIGANVRSFRAGYLAFNSHLINVLSNLGYSYNSSNSANNVLTNFPYRQRMSNAFSGLPSEIYEIPMTISDASKTLKLTEETLDTVTDEWLNVVQKNDANNAPTNLLIHPNRGWKLAAEQKLVSQMPASVKIMDVDAFGDYWLARRDLNFDYSLVNNKLTIQFQDDTAIDENQSLVITNGQDLESITLMNHSGKFYAFQLSNSKENDYILSQIHDAIVVPDPKPYRLIIHSKDDQGNDLADVNWLALSSDSTLMGSGNTGSNAIDTLAFTNTNSSFQLVLKTNKTDYSDFISEFSLNAEEDKTVITDNIYLLNQFQLKLSALDSESGEKLDSFRVRAYFHGQLLMEGESEADTLLHLETWQEAHTLDLQLLFDRADYLSSDSISVSLSDEQEMAVYQALVKEFKLDSLLLKNKNHLAILDLSDRDGESHQENLTSAIHMAEVAGIPYSVSSNVEEATQKDFILVSSEISETTLSADELLILKNWIAAGGIIIAPDLKNQFLYEAFGIASSKRDKYRYQLNWLDQPGLKELKWIDDEKEKSLPLAKADYYKSIYTRGYTLNTGIALAKFEDDRIAVSKNYYGQGIAYAFGVEWKDVILRNLLNKDYKAQRTYSNGFEPSTDVFMLMLRAIYTENQEISVYKHTSPGVSASSLLITHDVDSRTIIDSMNIFSNWEFIQNVSAQYFVTTHYFKDDYMSAYYEDSKFDKITELLDRNHTIGSHSVGHFPDFGKTSVFPEGNPGNTQFNYQPFYNGSYTEGGSVYGEVEVSHDLLTEDIGANIRSFRAGSLAFNPRLTNVLDDMGFAFNSSMSANNVLTNFPYFERTNKAFSGRNTSVLEIPMTLTDVSSTHKLVSTNINEVVGIWKDVIERNARNNAPTTLLISPNRGWKLQALEDLLNQLPTDVLTYNFEDYGDYWLDRNALDFDYYIQDNVLYIKLKSADIPASDLSLIIENGTALSRILVINSQNENIDFILQPWNTSDLILSFGQVSMRQQKSSKIDVPKMIQQADFNLFPNPSSDFVNFLFHSDVEENYKIWITDIEGRMVKEISGKAIKGSSLLRIDLTGFSRGMYLLNYNSKSQYQSLKLSVRQ